MKMKKVIFAVILAVVVAAGAAWAEPLEQICPSGQVWGCDTYPGTEATCGCKKGGPRVYSEVPGVSLLDHLLRQIFEK